MSDEKIPSSGSGAPKLLSAFDADIKACKEINYEIFKPERPDWSHWLKMSVVTIKGACWLSVDIDPRSTGQFELLRAGFAEVIEYYSRLQVVQSALFCKELNFIPVGKNFIDGMVKLADFVEWSSNAGYEIQEELRGIPDKKQSSFHDTKPDYLDESHPMFSRELSIAIEAWGQVLSKNPPKQKHGSRKQLISDWLVKHHNELTERAKDRIIVMLNPDSDGGSPATLND